MRATRSPFLAAVSTLAMLAAAAGLTIRARAATRPRYGGNLRVKMRERVNSMDPRDWYQGTADSEAGSRLLTLVFERLVALDDAGRVQPALAIAWQHDASFLRWQFTLRDGVRFHDGTPVTSDAVVAALQAEVPDRWHVATAVGQVVEFRLSEPHPDFLAELATGRSFIFRNAGATVVGTGAFRIADWQPQRELQLTASDDYWGGRPFVDRVDVHLGIAAEQQVTDLDLGNTDVTELTPSLLRRLEQSAGRGSASLPVELLALVSTHANSRFDARLSQAISLSLDRTAIVNVLLQRQGEPAGSLLPEWISGYAFTFATEPDLARAKELRAEVSGNAPLTLVYDSSDGLAAQIAQRVAVNARDAGIAINVTSEARTDSSSASHPYFRLMRLRLMPPDAEQALAGVLAQTEPSAGNASLPGLDTVDGRYAAERTAVEGGKVIPVAFVSELYAVSPTLRDWQIPKWGGWNLAEVWLDQGAHEPAPAKSEQR